MVRLRKQYKLVLSSAVACAFLYQFTLLLLNVTHKRPNLDEVACKNILNFNVVIPLNVSEENYKNYEFVETKCAENNKNEAKDTWREVIPSQDGRLFLFSAYYDDRPAAPVVRIMAAVLRKRKTPLYCLFPGQNEALVQVNATITFNSDDHFLKYCAGRIECVFPKSLQQITWVTVVDDAILDMRNISANMMLPLHERTPSVDFHQGSFAVCVKPLYNNYNKTLGLIEFIELHRILGVSHFYLYCHTVDSSVQQLLETYESLGIVTAFTWQLDIPSQTQIRTEGILVALNDCIYRSMYRYNYTVMVDFDEYIVPSKEISYLPLMQHLQNSNTGSFSFQNVFFYLNWKDDENWGSYTNASLRRTNRSATKIPRLVTLAKTTRVSRPNRIRQRSKYIARPVKLISAGNHDAERLWPGYKTLRVPVTSGFIHHYRTCEFGGTKCIHASNEIDQTTWRYASELATSVLDACTKIFPQTGECPPYPG